MGVYRTAIVPIVILFLITGVVGHNTGRLRELPVVGEPWDDLTTKLINGFYEATGIYLGTLGSFNQKFVDHIPLQAYDMELNKPKDSYRYPYWTYTSFPREKLPSILNSTTVQRFIDSVIEEAEGRVRGLNVSQDQYLLYLRGTAYEVMAERANYCAGGPTKDPRYVVTHCGDCDDWHVVAYALISKINRQYGVKARYFLTSTVGHAFLTVYYPEDGKWELYDWFPPIGVPAFDVSRVQIKCESIRNRMLPDGKNVALNGYCPLVFGISKDECVFKIRRFESFGRMHDFYSIYGEGTIKHLYELPSLRYVEGKEIRRIWN